MPTLDELLYQLSRPIERQFHLFISHSWDYGEDRTNLGNLIQQGLAPYTFIDYSAPKDHPIHSASNVDLYLALMDRIGRAKVLIFPAGVYASYSKWIPTEILIAKKLNKPILAVEKFGSQRSSAIAEAANQVLGWNSKTIGEAIQKWHP